MLPEQLLWIEVLKKAIQDAMIVPRPQNRQCSLVSSRVDVMQARSFLTDNTQDFKIVCHLAGLQPEFVMATYQNIKSFGRKYKNNRKKIVKNSYKRKPINDFEYSFYDNCDF